MGQCLEWFEVEQRNDQTSSRDSTAGALPMYRFGATFRSGWHLGIGMVLHRSGWHFRYRFGATSRSGDIEARATFSCRTNWAIYSPHDGGLPILSIPLFRVPMRSHITVNCRVDGGARNYTQAYLYSSNVSVLVRPKSLYTSQYSRQIKITNSLSEMSPALNPSSQCL